MDRLIIGCGFLGIEVARLWLQQGDRVFALTRDRARFQQRFPGPLDRRIELLEGDLTVADQIPALPPVGTLLWAVGMDRRRYSDIFSVYVQGLQGAISRLETPPRHWIYISSTGVYGNPSPTDLNRPSPWVDEDSPTSPTREGGQACLLAEQLLTQWQQSGTGPESLSLLRLAGIYGAGRIPLLASIQARDWAELNPTGFLNLIHVSDGARIVQAIADDPAPARTAETLNVSDGNPVLRQKFYETIAQLAGAGEIDWSHAGDSHPKTKTRGDKKLNNQRLLDRLPAFQFHYPDYQSGLAQAFAETGD